MTPVCVRMVWSLKHTVMLQRMRLGVERDMERQVKKEENRQKLEEQRVLEDSLKKRDNNHHN